MVTFFASDDRLHKLQSGRLRAIVDSVLFEPGRHLASNLLDVQPVMVPTPYPELLATPYGSLMNELVQSPETVLRAMKARMRPAK